MSNMILMHGDIPAAIVKVINNRIYGYEKILDKSHLPVGTYSDNATTQRLLLDAWVKSRCIPNGRPGMDLIYQKIGMDNAEAFIKSAAISLTDRFWIKEECSSLSWKDVNFHDNGFIPVIGNIIAGMEQSFMPSPDFTTDGMMTKFWMTQAGQPFLVKIDDKFGNTLTANEVFAYKVADYLSINHVSYLHNEFVDNHVCSCPCFISNSDDEFINALQISHEKLGRTGMSLYTHLKEKYGISNDFDKMVFLDCLIGNVDRHEKNYGLVKRKDGTFSFAPIFDSGSCLDYSMNNLNGRFEFELKTPKNKRRSEALPSLSVLPEFDERILHSFLQETYELFDVSEKKYEVAKNELNFGISIIEKERSNRNALYVVSEQETEVDLEL